ncbi:hypothetical protein G6F62_013560 [Rhizopus arrhizus]|nr:hypothetical protein G6F23_014091 [Rhizopus arrhizus]KAG0762310.1 hypothetical protein G6F22_018680 [Rhizopus arrhizus]KAG0940251.1 hypothetical protein G6F31_015184 [Rhizopus arrhizus]KAG1180806.1 hypothetical protein G6F35_016103 [Rhizopus arrhizus]KAG1316356.1 hypothetical protein G6F62_013560 [Rhizopus arrhizus]
MHCFRYNSNSAAVVMAKVSGVLTLTLRPIPIFDLRPSPVETPRSLWEAVKVEVKRVARSFGRKQASWQQLHLSRLQAKRDRLLSSQSPTSGLHPSLTRTEKLIGHLQTDIQWPSKLVACFHILPIHVADYFVS